VNFLADQIPFQLSRLSIASCGDIKAGRHMRHGSSASDKPFEPSRGLAWLLAALAIAIGVALAALAMSLPDPAPKSAPADAFSAERAMDDVRAIAVRPHPIGSPEIEQVRTVLVARMRALGLDPQLRLQDGVTTILHMKDLALAGRVRNIVGELKGSDPSLPAVVIMAHYDTVAHSPGAGDDTSGIAVALETARALRASGGLRRSVIFLFTDGEEAGLLGATAFFDGDPLLRRVGVVINLEARGDSGRTAMFQTSPGNRGLVQLYGRNAKSPTADSLTVTLYKQMPNDTDLTAALNKGYAGLNFAFAGHQMAYHTPVSTPESLSAGSLQHMGDQVLPVVRALARAGTLPESGGDMVFADLFGLVFVAYPIWVGWLLALAGFGAALATLGIGIGRGRFGWRDAARGAGGLLALLLGIAAILMLELRLVAFLLSDVASPYALIAQFGWLAGAAGLLGTGTGMLLIHAAANGKRRAAALTLATAGLVGALLGTFSAIILGIGIVAALLAVVSFGKRVGMVPFFTGAVALLAIAALALQILLPNGAHVLVWPLLLLAGIAAALVFVPDRAARPAGLAAIFVAVSLLIGLMATNGYGFFVLMGPMLPAIVTLFVVLAVLALVPLIWSLRAWAGGAVVVAGLALCVVAGIRGRTPSAATPEMVEVFHVSDPEARTAYWASGKLDPSGWVKASMERDGGTAQKKAMPPLLPDPVWTAKAKPSEFVRPGLELSMAGEGAARRIGIRATNANGGRYMRIFLKSSVAMAGLTLAGKKLPGKLAANTWSQLTFHASGTDPVEVTLPPVGAHGKLEVQMVEVRDGWPAGAKSLPKPANVVPVWRDGTSAIIARSTIGW
jgi:MFS family permease